MTTAPLSDSFKFSNAEDAERDLPIEDALAFARHAVEVFGAARDGGTSRELAFWRRQVDLLERDVRHTPDPCVSLAGPCAEDFRWRVLRFDRCDKDGWDDLCQSIDRYFDKRETEASCLTRFRTTGETTLWTRALDVRRQATARMGRLYGELAAKRRLEKSGLDFPLDGEHAAASVPKHLVLSGVKVVADLCSSGCDDRASALSRSWKDLHEHLSNAEQTTVEGDFLEVLRWRYLQWNRRNDSRWWTLIGKIDDYSALVKQLQLVRRAADDETCSAQQKVERRAQYESIAELARTESKALHDERRRLLASQA